ncbi:hypothetical protein J6590_088523 [Homalodisca vitripennis]|nr:hypothetical protein J6590_088523 [Homalodisca vitripennis]
MEEISDSDSVPSLLRDSEYVPSEEEYQDPDPGNAVDEVQRNHSTDGTSDEEPEPLYANQNKSRKRKRNVNTKTLRKLKRNSVSRSWPTDPGRVESDQGLYCDDVGAGLQPTSLPQLQPHTRKLKKFSHITFYHFTVRHHPHLIFTYSGDRPCIVPSSTDFPAQYFVVTDMNIYHSPISWVLSKEYSHLL